MSTRFVPMAFALALGAAMLPPTLALAKSTAKPSAETRTFMQHAAIGGMAEVEMGKLAEQKASNDAVKQFGARMVADHGKANTELETLAKDKGITLPTQVDAKHKAEQQRLAKLSGAAFDRAYVNGMVEDHVHDVEEFRKVAKTAKDPDVKAFAERTLPTLEEHLAQVKQLQTQVASGASGSTTRAAAQ